MGHGHKGRKRHAGRVRQFALLAGVASLLAACSVDGVMTPPADLSSTSSISPAQSAPQLVGRVGDTPNAVSMVEASTPDAAYPIGDAGSDQLIEGRVSAPVVSGIGTDDLVSVNAPSQDSGSAASFDDPLITSVPQAVPGDNATAAAEPARKEGRFAMLGRALNPLSRSAPAHSGMPKSEVSCRSQLKRLGVRYEDLPRISGPGSCGIAYPVEVSGLSGNIAVKPAAKLNCPMAVQFARWVKGELGPTARTRYLSGVKSITQLSSYSCRTMNSRKGAPMSEHSKGNAIDIGKITLDSGKSIVVRKPGLFALREKSLLNSVRADSCKYFTTVLGPGSDRHHKDHFHLDLRSRKSGKRYCN